MKTLAQIKNEISVKKGYFSWSNLISSGHLTITLDTIDELLVAVQKECLKNALENKETYVLGQCGCEITYEESITNENNIIK